VALLWHWPPKDGGAPELLQRQRAWSRQEVLDYLRDDLPPDTLVGIDMGLSLPFMDCGAYFPGLHDSPPDARSLWGADRRHRLRRSAAGRLTVCRA
jgi:hypothetical protein